MVENSAVLITGIQAAGKSTVGRMLARRFPRGAFIEGDLMRQLIVSGGKDVTPDMGPEALRQVHLRYRNGALLVDSLVSAGFTAVHVDIIVQQDLMWYTQLVRSRPLRIIVLTPDPKVVVQRELARGTDAYSDWEGDESSLEDAVREFQKYLEQAPRIGLWIDSSHQSPEETVDEILSRWDEAVV